MKDDEGDELRVSRGSRRVLGSNQGDQALQGETASIAFFRRIQGHTQLSRFSAMGDPACSYRINAPTIHTYLYTLFRRSRGGIRITNRVSTC
jgi:hypothetical protein